MDQPRFIDMAMSDAEYKAAGMSCSPDDMNRPKYPWGLCISLDNDAINKLDIGSLPDAGDIVHLLCIAKVTSVSSNDTTDGTRKRIELQITSMATGLADEEADEEPPRKMGLRNPYK